MRRNSEIYLFDDFLLELRQVVSDFLRLRFTEFIIYDSSLTSSSVCVIVDDRVRIGFEESCVIICHFGHPLSYDSYVYYSSPGFLVDVTFEVGHRLTGDINGFGYYKIC